MEPALIEDIPFRLKLARGLRYVAASCWAGLIAYAFFFVDGDLMGMAGVISAVSFLWGIVALASCSLCILHIGLNSGLPASLRLRRHEASLVLGNRHNKPASVEVHLNLFELPVLTQGMIFSLLFLMIFAGGVMVPLIVPALPFLIWICADIWETIWLDVVRRNLRR